MGVSPAWWVCPFARAWAGAEPPNVCRSFCAGRDLELVQGSFGQGALRPIFLILR